MAHTETMFGELSTDRDAVETGAQRVATALMSPEPSRLPRIIQTRDVELTDDEQKVLEHLAVAWNIFTKLPSQRPPGSPPVIPASNVEFAQHLHSLQYMIAFRVAVRVNPEIWVP